MRAIRRDLFRAKKDIHIKLNKTTHAEFRKRLFEYGVSMQWAIEEFAQLVAKGDKRATKIIDNLAIKLINKEIQRYKGGTEPVDELDHEALYSLIGDTDDNNEDNEEEESLKTGTD